MGVAAPPAFIDDLRDLARHLDRAEAAICRLHTSAAGPIHFCVLHDPLGNAPVHSSSDRCDMCRYTVWLDRVNVGLWPRIQDALIDAHSSILPASLALARQSSERR